MKDAVEGDPSTHFKLKLTFYRMAPLSEPVCSVGHHSVEGYVRSINGRELSTPLPYSDEPEHAEDAC